MSVLTALALGQVSVVAAWLAFRQSHDAWSYIVPIVSVSIAAFVRGKLSIFGGFTWTDYACRTALQMLGALIVLWLIRRTIIWRWLSTETASYKWEFSMRQLLLFTTLAALFWGLLARSTWSDGEFQPLIAVSGIFAPPATAIGVVLVAQLGVGWVVRLCGYIAVGAIVATALANGRNEILILLNFEFILEAIVIAAWVEWGGIVPRRRTAQTITATC